MSPKRFSCQNAKERHLELFAEKKKTRVPGKPRHLIDCYLDELDKVCVSCRYSKRELLKI